MIQVIPITTVREVHTFNQCLHHMKTCKIYHEFMLSESYLTLCAPSWLCCILFRCRNMITIAIMKKPMLARKISITGAMNDQINDVLGFK